MKKLRLGLDIGTSSVGYALVDENNNIIKKNKHAFWGDRLFEEGKTAVDRRQNRTNRRRLARRKFRVEIIRDLFFNEIKGIDPTFFERLDDSFFYQEDKKNKNSYNIFTEKYKYSDYDFFKEYPTIFHLRNALMTEDKKFDIRMVYLAVVHIVKYRGNFLYSGEFNTNDSTIVKQFFENFNETMSELKSEFVANDEEFTNDEWFERLNDELINSDEFYSDLKSILTSTEGKMDKKKKLIDLFNCDKKSLYSEFVAPLLVGSVVNLKSLTPVKEFKYEDCKVNLDCEDIKALENDAKDKIKDLYRLFDTFEELKSVYDFYFVSKILNESSSISEAMIRMFNDHNIDLNKLKAFFKKYSPDQYNSVFRDDTKNNYRAYVGYNKVKGKTTRTGHVSREDFYNFLKKQLENVNCEEAVLEKEYFLKKIENEELLLRQNSNQNGAFPKQLHFKELDTILHNQAKYYPFLNEVSDGYSTLEKIEKTFNFKVEYYVGPLNTKSEHSWVVRNSFDKIYPWNIDEIVNKDESAIKFIQKMQNKCTYLDSEYCLPKASIVFSEYNCLAYLNKITVNGCLLSPEIKEEVLREVFFKKNKPTNKDICVYLNTHHGEALTTNRKELPDVNCSMSSYIQMVSVFGEEYVKGNSDVIESVIQDITIFEDKKALGSRLKKEYNLDDEKIKKIKGFNYKGYSRISKKLIDGLECVDDETGEYCTLLDIMRKTNLNLQEILYSQRFNFAEVIENENKKNKNEFESLNDFIDENVAVSPSFKRAIIQAYTIIEEIEKIFKRPIDEYYVECTRTNKADKKKTKSRYEKVKDLYKECTELSSQYNLKSLESELDNHKDDLKSDLLYLYFTQLGKCMYSLEPISLEDLIANNKEYDIDHIYPQSIIKDDSISNRVLVKKSKNAAKTDKFLFETNVQAPQARQFYALLLDHNLISKEKYKRLTETQISEEQLNGFVNRQLVSTNQSVTGLIKVLKEYHNVDPQNIIYSKGENVSDFRKAFDLVKSRTANNYHHAHDAYLNVVVGGILDKYYKSKGFMFFKDYDRLKNEGYSINPIRIFKGKPGTNKIIEINGKVIWDRDRDVEKINHTLYERFDITETHRTYNSNELYKKVTILPKGQGTVPIQSSTLRADMSKYGAIDSSSYSRYVIVECKGIKGKKEIKDVILEAIPKSAIPNENTVNEDINKYLKSIYEDKYIDFNIVNYNIKTNCIVEFENKKFVISSKTGDSYNVKNIIDRNFSKESMKIIKKIDKYINLKSENKLDEVDKKLIISPARNNETEEVSLTKEELKSLLAEIKCLYSKDIYSYSSLSNMFESFELDTYSFEELFKLCSELLKLLKTNERKLCDLTILNHSKNYGTLTIGKKLKPGMKFLSESVTGYYKKVIYEVK